MNEVDVINDVRSPEILKQFLPDDLKKVAHEIRQRILQVLSVNGGHLASNLGSVEFTLALHYVFNSPSDQFIFDVSHQTYTHKLITGRNHSGFEKIRKYKGLSGFAHPKESEHDHFFAGHAGTALSLALGVAQSRDIHGKDNYVIPIIGDATLTCGLSLEALNNIPRDLRKFIVVLNDNEMSISENVGRINHVLSRLLSNPTISKLSYEIELLLSKIPLYGSSLAKQGQRITESIKNLVSAAPFFEQFGLSYIGPIDGHDLKKMITTFQGVKNLNRPVLIHLLTKKGQGVEVAERDPVTYHGVKPFDPDTCKFLPSPTQKPTFPKIFGKHLLEMGKNNPHLSVVTPAMSLGSCLDAFKLAFPKRFFDVGIAEGHAVTFSGGLAKNNHCRVICSIYSTFLQRALDNLFHDICLQDIPVVFAIDRAGVATGDGATHHGIYEISFLRSMPNMVICQPRDGNVLKELLESAFQWNRPTSIRYPNIITDDSKAPLHFRPLGKAEILAEGKDLLIVALGHMCYAAMELRKQLAEEGISATVIDPIFVKPLDSELFEQLLFTHSRIVTLEEHSLKGGLGAEINEFVLTRNLNRIEILNLGIPEAFFEHGGYNELLNEMGLTQEKMFKRIITHFTFTKTCVQEKK
ncbi:MAG: 1-deoxy-D-xylulose-5-phosphate synthase [Chlamydiales bacterium]